MKRQRSLFTPAELPLKPRAVTITITDLGAGVLLHVAGLDTPRDEDTPAQQIARQLARQALWTLSCRGGQDTLTTIELSQAGSLSIERPQPGA
jgi:hypothetical protein